MWAIIKSQPRVNMCLGHLLCAVSTQPSAKGLASHRPSKNILQMKMCMLAPLNSATTEVPETIRVPEVPRTFWFTDHLDIYYLL